MEGSQKGGEMHRYVILGSQGQLGRELVWQLEQVRRREPGVDFVAADIEECDISDVGEVHRFFGGLRSIDVVVNAAAYTAVDRAEDEEELAMSVNGLGAGYVAAAAREIGARLIHISTDFVFGEGHQQPIDELAAPAPLSVYGRTKLAGEELALQNHLEVAVLRTSGLYSRWGHNFVRAVVQRARDTGELEVVDDQVVTPTSASSLARVILELAEAPLFVGGVYHASAQGGASWYECAQKVVQCLDMEVQITPVSGSRWGAPAPRPSYSVLENRRLRLLGLDDLPRWDEDLENFLGREQR